MATVSSRVRAIVTLRCIRKCPNSCDAVNLSRPVPRQCPPSQPLNLELGIASSQTYGAPRDGVTFQRT